jgi:hypothetical protein
MKSATTRFSLVLALVAILVLSVALSGCSSTPSTPASTTPGVSATGTPEGGENPNVQSAPGEESAPVETSPTNAP